MKWFCIALIMCLISGAVKTAPRVFVPLQYTVEKHPTNSHLSYNLQPIYTASQNMGFSKAQVGVVRLCLEEASKYFKKDLNKQKLLATTIVGMAWRETKLGLTGPIGDIHNGFGKRSYGIMQVKLASANAILSQNPRYTVEVFGKRNPVGERVITELITNPRFNIHIGTLYLMRMQKIQRMSWNDSIRAYNAGPGNYKSEAAHKYYESVHFTRLRLLEEEQKLNADSDQTILEHQEPVRLDHIGLPF